MGEEQVIPKKVRDIVDQLLISNLIIFSEQVVDIVMMRKTVPIVFAYLDFPFNQSGVFLIFTLIEPFHRQSLSHRQPGLSLVLERISPVLSFHIPKP